MGAVAIYARYSTEEQDPRSIEDQIRRCREHAERAAYKVVAEFSDAAISGSHTERPALIRLRDAVTGKRRAPFGAVLVDDLSRLSRSIGDTWRIIDDLAAAGVRVIDVRTGMASDDPNARVMFAASSMVNDQFLQLVRYQTHRGLQGRALAGFSTGGSQYGFATIPEPNPSNRDKPRKLWIVEEREAEITRRVFREYDEGASSYKAIADGLNRDGIPAPRDGSRGGNKIGKGWGHTTILALLKNRRYIGEWTWNQTKWIAVPGKSKRRRLDRPESEHVTKTYPELAIVDRDVFDRVQARLSRVHHVAADGTRRGRPPGAGTSPYLVSGLLKCGECGGPMSICGQRKKNGVRYATFGCTAHRSRGSSICSNASTISERKITGALIDALREVLTSPEVVEAFAGAFERRVRERQASEPRTTAGDAEKLLAAARKRVANATRLIVEMPDDLDLRRQREADKAEVHRLESEIASRAKSTTRALPDPGAIRAALTGFVDHVAAETPERGREALARVLPDRLTVSPDPDAEKPGVVVTGSLRLSAVVVANSSSGGAATDFADVGYPLEFRILRRAV